MKTVAIIQARMGSTRLPGKVLMKLGGVPVLRRVYDRASQIGGIGAVLVATTTSAADDELVQFCESEGIPVFRGSEADVLDRYVQAARFVRADAIMRITADCPFLDPEESGRVLHGFLADALCDYASNIEPPTLPDGLDTEVVKMSALEWVWKNVAETPAREHVTLYIRQHRDQFRCINVQHVPNLSAHRWTLDEPRDFDFLSAVAAKLDVMHRQGTLSEILGIIKASPEILRMNAHIERNEGLKKSLDEWSQTPGEGRGQALYRKARTLIPGGTQLLSKRPEMFLPKQWPAYYSRAKGVDVWDLDGKKYIDMAYNGIGACILGACDPDVDAAVTSAVQAGSMSTLNAPEEVELAELLCELHPWAQMARYARCGGEAMAIAVRIARAATGRDRVAFCGYHGWNDWYLAANLSEEKALDGHLLSGLQPAGVPRGLIGTALPFRYNRIAELEAIVAGHGKELAAIVMEPIRDRDPDPGFLERVRELATTTGAVLIFDEITAGFRLNTGGAHLLCGVNPDVAIFAKAISNGYPMAAIIGRREIMEAAQTTFISSTYWTERIGPAAAIATIRKHRRCNVAEHLVRVGSAVRDGWETAAREAGLELDVGGIRPLGHFSFRGEQKQAAKTLFVQLMLARGFLASTAFYATYAHHDEHVKDYVVAVEEVFGEIASALSSGTLLHKLKGPVAHTGFQRLT